MIGDIKKFRFWCQKVIPLVYDNSLSYYEVLCKVVDYLNKVIEDINEIPSYIDAKIEEALDDEHLKELLEQFIVDIEAAISSHNEGDNTNSSADYNVGQMLWWNGKLYKVIRQIDVGDTFIVDTNIELVNFEDLFNDFVDEVKHDITANDDGGNTTASQSWTAGDWLWLNDVLYIVTSDITEGNAYIFTGDNANVRQITIEEMHNSNTALINAVDTKVGDLDDLDTTDKSSVVGAINEIEADTELLKKIAIYVNVKEYGAIGDGTTDDTQAIKDAFAAASNKTAIYFPSGEYKVSDTIDVNCPFVYGDGEASVIKYYGDDKLFYVKSTGVTIKDLLLVADDNTSSIGIYVLDKNFTVIENVYLNDFYDCIVFDGTCFYATCTRLKGFHWKHAYIKTQDTAGTSTAGHQIAFENISFASGEGEYVFYLDNIGSFNFSDVLCSPQNITTATIHWGTMAPLAGLTWLVNTGLESAPKAMEFDATPEHYFFYFTNCYFGGHVSLVRCRQMTFTGCYFTGNEISCDLYLTQDITFEGCHFLNALNSCIALSGGNYDTTMISCTNPNPGTYPFITRVDNTIPVKIIGCGIKTPNIESLGDLTNIRLSANNFDDTYSEVISTTSAPLTITTNLGSTYAARSYGIVPLNTNAIQAQFDCTLTAGNVLVCYPHGTYDTTQPVQVLAFAKL